MDGHRLEALKPDEKQPAPVPWNGRDSDAQFWTGKRGLSIVQLAGVIMMFVTIGGVFWSDIYWQLWVYKANGSLLELLISGFGGWIIALAVFGALFLLLRWRVRRALLVARQHTPDSENMN